MSDVRTPTAAAVALHQHAGMIAALLGGTQAMRDAGRAFLPQFPAETDAAYRVRCATATLFPAFARTVAVLTGKPFSRPVTVGEDVPAAVRDLLGNIDGEGRGLDAYAASVAGLALAHGFCGVLVDAPPSPKPGATTVAEERAAGLRPYCVTIRPDAVLGWRTAKRGAGRVLTMLRLLEAVDEPDGEFGEVRVEQVRVLYPGAWQVWRKSMAGGREEWALHAEGVTTLDVIPFVPVYGLRVDFMAARPPMLDLAFANVEHWQSASDQQTILHVARVPLLFGRMLGEAEIKVGADSFVASDDPNADLRYVEHSGAAIEAGRKSILDLEDRMRQAGAELLVIKPGNITVSQTAADTEQGASDLQRIVQGLEGALDQVLGLLARWLRLPAGGHVQIYQGFGAATLAEASAALLVEMEGRGSLSRETTLGELKRRGILAPEVDVAEEFARIAAERDAREAADDAADDKAERDDPGGEPGRMA